MRLPQCQICLCYLTMTSPNTPRCEALLCTPTPVGVKLRSLPASQTHWSVEQNSDPSPSDLGIFPLNPHAAIGPQNSH